VLRYVADLTPAFRLVLPSGISAKFLEVNATLLQRATIVHLLTAILLWFAQPAEGAAPTQCAGVHGVWVWNTFAAIGSATELDRLTSTLNAIGATNAYLYLQTSDYVNMESDLVRAITQSTRAGVRVWGLQGSRDYFRDVVGPADLLAAADALIAFNNRHASDAKFSGFVSDIEPQDGQGSAYPSHFHNGLPDSMLSSRQAAERQTLMADWASIHEMLHSKMRSAGLLYAAAVPSWTDDYYGEPVHVVAGGRKRVVTEILMASVDEYIVMSYSTNPQRAVDRVLSKTVYADRLGGDAPRVIAAVETHKGAGRGVSYGEDHAKGTKAAVLADIQSILSALSRHPSFGGVDVHDWTGWSSLPP
jgi:hypothetical protein